MALTSIHPTRIIDEEMAQRFPLDFSGFDGTQKRAVKKSFTDKFPLAAGKLTVKTPIPGMPEIIKKRKAAGKSQFFVLHGKTTHIEFNKFIRKYELWHIKNLMNNVKGENDADINAIYDRMRIFVHSWGRRPTI